MWRLYSFYELAGGALSAAGGGSFQHLGMWALTLQQPLSPRRKLFR